MWAIEHCRTRALGGHLYQCQTCATGCPCTTPASAATVRPARGLPSISGWRSARSGCSRPTTSTSSSPCPPSCARSSAATAGCLRSPVRGGGQHVADLCRDPTHLGAEVGVSLVLHTWTRALTFHPHVHGIFPGGGLAAPPTPDRWVACDKEFLIHVDVLAAVFRGKFLDALQAAYARGAFTDDTHLDPTRSGPWWTVSTAATGTSTSRSPRPLALHTAPRRSSSTSAATPIAPASPTAGWWR